MTEIPPDRMGETATWIEFIAEAERRGIEARGLAQSR
jgi:hypothetical protein